MKVVDIIFEEKKPYHLGECQCEFCIEERKRVNFIAITEFPPARRTIHYEHLSHDHPRGNHKDGYHFLLLPYVRMMVSGRGIDSPDGVKYAWNNDIRVLGSLEPYSSVDQPVFALPMPNSNESGLVTCIGDMRLGGKRFDSIESLALTVSENYWHSRFSYWPFEFQTGRDFKVLQGGLKTLRTIPANLKMRDFGV